MSQEHGAAFTLMRQKNPTFTRTKGGGFDVGYRRFKCHQEDVGQLMLRYFAPGTVDSQLLRVASGGTLPGYSAMLISNAAVEQEEGDRAVIRAEYEGLMFAKRGSIEFDTGSHEQSAVGTLGGYTIVRASHLVVPVPTVVHTFVAVQGRPSIVSVGKAATPPGVTENETELAEQYHADFVDGMQTLFEGWVLANRKMRAPGNVMAGPLWEVVDTYQFQVVRVPATAS